MSVWAVTIAGARVCSGAAYLNVPLKRFVDQLTIAAIPTSGIGQKRPRMIV